MIPTSFSAVADTIATMVVVSFLVFYTGYSKANRRLEPRQLIDILTFRNGLRSTLKEFNKVAGLAGLTLIAGALLCQHAPHSGVKALGLVWGRLLTLGQLMCLAHGGFSAYEYRARYSDSRYTVWMLLGSATMTALLILSPFDIMQGPQVGWLFADAIAFANKNYAIASLAVLGLALGHVIGMERFSKTALERSAAQNWLCMRPFGSLSVATAIAAALVIVVTTFVALA